MKLKILSFSWESFSSKSVISITLKTKSWELTVLENHSPLIASIKPSILYVKFKDENNITQRDDFAIWSWVIEVKDSSVKIVADMLVDIDEVNKWKAEEARLKAIELMSKYKNSENKTDMANFIQAEDMLLKSIAQLKLANLRK